MKHGANIYKYAKEIDCKADEIIDFSSNINSYHPKIDITLTNNMLVKYADTNYTSLKKIISKKYEIKKSQIALYNGATSAIFELLRHLDSSRVYLYAPLYGEYEKAVDKNTKIIKINRFENLYKKVKKGSTVVFVNPSTPDGKFYNLERLFGMWKKQDCRVLIDESFLEFQNNQSLINQIYQYDKIWIIKSFTKFYSCPGIRIGAIFSNKKNIKALKAPLWNLSSFDVKFLSSRLEDLKFEKRSKKLHKTYKAELLKTLKKSKLFDEIYESDSNFILTKSKRAKEIFEHLLSQKILVRTCGSFDFLKNDFLRFAVKDFPANKQLKQSLKMINIK
ncbi:aminotransferase class I/II-fold pyridoxal phosphate-dependent enzyme [Sulfurimonas sp.]